MTVHNLHRLALAAACALLLVFPRPLVAQTAAPVLSLTSGQVTISGTSNIHDYTAVSTVVKLSRVTVASTEGKSPLEAVLEPGALTAFDIAVPVASLSSPREGLDKNLYKALKAEQHQEIVFRLTRLEAGGTPGVFRAVGVLRVAGVERDVTLSLTATATAASLTVRGEIPLVMTEFGVSPPRAMLGMLRTDPKVKVAFEVVLQAPQP